MWDQPAGIQAHLLSSAPDGWEGTLLGTSKWIQRMVLPAISRRETDRNPTLEHLHCLRMIWMDRQESLNRLEGIQRQPPGLDGNPSVFLCTTVHFLGGKQNLRLCHRPNRCDQRTGLHVSNRQRLRLVSSVQGGRVYARCLDRPGVGDFKPPQFTASLPASPGSPLDFACFDLW